MAVRSGLAENLYVDGRDLSGDVGVMDDWSSPRETFEVQGMDRSAFERIQARAGGQFSFNSWFNDALLQEHLTLRGVPAMDRRVTWVIGLARGDPAVMMVAQQLSYDGTRGDDGSLAHNTRGVSNGVAPEWGEMATAGKITDAAAANGASFDNLVSTPSGAAAVMHLFDLASGTVTITIEDSPDNAVFATLIAFASVADGAEPASERLTVTGTVDRHIRVITTGVFTNAQYSVAIRRGDALDDAAY